MTLQDTTTPLDVQFADDTSSPQPNTAGGSNTDTTNPQHHQQPEGQTRILIYADGSCKGNPGPGGWATVIRRYVGDTLTKRLKLSGHEAQTTNNRMELIAAIKALGCLRSDEDAPITIRTDSLYVIDGITKYMPRWIAKGWRLAGGGAVKNRDLWEELLRLCVGRNITWQWVKGHAGETKNEEVDAMASAEAAKANGQRFAA